MGEDRKLNHCQACAILGCKKTQFYSLVKKGELKAFRLVGSKRGLWVYESDCLALVKASSVADTAELP